MTRTRSLFGSLLPLLLVCTGSAAANDEQAEKGQPLKFAGLSNPAFTSPAGRTVPFFVDVSMCDLALRACDLAPLEAGLAGSKTAPVDEFLVALTKEGTELKEVFEAAADVYKIGLGVTINDVRLKQFAVVAAYPRVGTLAKKEFKKAATFSPGSLTELKGIVERFGAASQEQAWSADEIGLVGLVRWWGRVGVATTADDEVSHVLIRSPVAQ